MHNIFKHNAHGFHQILRLSIALFLFLCPYISFSQTDLKLGDIAFVDYHSDGDDRFTFVTFKDLEVGTQITFDENGWESAGGLRSTEGSILWQATAIVTAGTLIEVNSTGGDFSSSTGTITESGIFALSTSGDQIFAYQGTAPTGADQSNFLTAIQMNGAWDADATSANTSAQPPIFTDGKNSVSISPERDNGEYNFSNDLDITPDLKASINTASNWITTNSDATLDGVAGDSTIAIVRPGGVNKQLDLWIDANNYTFTDAGLNAATNTQTIQEWHDLSSNADDFSQTVLAEKPSLSTNAFNFNSGITFTDNFLTRTSVLKSTISYANTNYFIVYEDDNQTDFDWVFYEGTPTSTIADRFSLSWNSGGMDQADLDATSSNNLSFANQTLAPASTSYLLSSLNSTSPIYGVSGTDRQVININGLEASADNTYSALTGTGGDISLGANQVSADGGKGSFSGKIAEFFILNDQLTATELSQIESYLALKYGITLDQSVSSSYLASDGSTVFWNPLSSPGFGNDIAGIARDDVSGQNQKQSVSRNSDAILSLGLTNIASTNKDNANAFTTDLSALVWSNNNGDIEGNSTDIGTTTNSEVIEARLSRTWHAQETGSVGTTKIRFDLSEVIGVSGTAGNNDLNEVRLLVDTDGTFMTGATSISPSSVNNTTDIVEFDHDFVAGTGYFFSLGSVDLTSAPLPVVWGEIILSETIAGLNINWNTFSEANNSHFLVYRSSENETWEVIDTVMAKNLRNGASYHSEDKDKYHQVTYYKIMQIDKNGDSDESKIFTWTPEQNTKISFYPNPVTSQLNLLNWTDENSWKIFDIQGIKLLSGNSAVINLRELKTGIYFLKDSIGRSLRFTKK